MASQDLERFMARPGISLTVEYGSDHFACSILIEPPGPLLHHEESPPLMSSGYGVKEILEEVCAVKMRGMIISIEHRVDGLR